MNIENLKSVEAAATLYEGAPAHELMLQQVGIRSTQHALEFLLKYGVTEENVHAMYENMTGCLFALHEVAQRRGIELLSYR